MRRKITAFEQDEEADWVALLDCGHRRHMRHDPPFVDRAWVTDPVGRQSKLGEVLDCQACGRLEMPDGLQRYKETAQFNQDTLPKGLQNQHKTGAGVWGKIEVAEGALNYTILEPERRVLQLAPGIDGIIPPEMLHFVTPQGLVSLRVAFYRQARTQA